jgi:hypothetical protein
MSGLATKATVFRSMAVPLRSTDMLDIILVAGALGFFALSVGYTIACDRL